MNKGSGRMLAQMTKTYFTKCSHHNTTLGSSSVEEMVFCANLKCPFPLSEVSHLTLGNSLACFSFCSVEWPRQVQPQRCISYCLSHCCNWIGLFSACGLEELKEETTGAKEVSVFGPCESSSFIILFSFYQSSHTADSSEHLQHQHTCGMTTSI